MSFAKGGQTGFGIVQNAIKQEDDRKYRDESLEIIDNAEASRLPH